MSKIKIKNFGPIKEGYFENDGWLEINKVTLFTGNQGSGKSTIAKLISTFTWIEKALTRGDHDIKYFQRKNKLRNQFLTYHRIQNYIHTSEKGETTLIDYKGDSFCIRYEKGSLHIEESTSTDYPLPQIMYVPAERNFIANVKKATALRLTSDALVEFVTEYNNALGEMKNALLLPINNVRIEYNKSNDIAYVKGTDYRLRLTEASSGFQSLIPLYLVSRYLATSVKRKSDDSNELMTPDQRERFRKRVQALSKETGLTEEQRRILISEEAKKFNKSAFINIVEEAEQNLYPTSQWEMLKSLLAMNNISKGNKLVMTTHSPYFINYLTLAVKAYTLLQQPTTAKVNSKIQTIVPELSTVRPEDLVIYELDEVTGVVKKLPTYHNIPSDENQLNEVLSESNELYAQLLEIQQGL